MMMNFLSCNSCNNNIPHKPFGNNDSCFISKEDPSIFSFPLPSPFMHYEDEVVLFQDLQNLQFQQPSLSADNAAADTVIKTNAAASDPPRECNSSAAAEQLPRRKSCKKDRHSKINTAHGPRDRRMRLSLEVARKFFDLQDMLGFDKASKTVEWLLTKSRYAIKELSGGLPSGCALGANSASSTSECEVISGVDESATNENQQGQTKAKPSSCNKEKKKAKAARRVPFHPLAKQSRAKARERARERTKEKKRRLIGEEKLHMNGAAIDIELTRLRSSWGSVEAGEESAATQDCAKITASNELLKEVEQDQLISPPERQIAGTAENLAGDSMVAAGGNWSPSALFNSFHLNNGGICTTPQFMDLHQFYCRSSEAYSNMNLCG